jgi:phosphonate utilization transcriptional regulator
METATPLQLLRSTSLPTLVHQEVIRSILEGEILAGDRITEEGLALKLGVSRGPVREAFRSLEEAGLVRLLKNRGVFVREISVEEATELYSIRAAYDDLAGRTLAPKITKPQLAELNAMVSEMDKLTAEEHRQRYYVRNIRFHDRIVEMTGNVRLLSLYRKLMNEMHLIRRRTLVHGDGRKTSVFEHHAIMEALRTRNPDLAARRLREHVYDSHRRFMSFIEHEANAGKTVPKPDKVSRKPRAVHKGAR